MHGLNVKQKLKLGSTNLKVAERLPIKYLHYYTSMDS